MRHRKGTKQPWVDCHSGRHRWPAHLAGTAGKCCAGIAPAETGSPRVTPNHLCWRGRHQWRSARDARRCCRTHVPVWEPLAPPDPEGFEMLRQVLVPQAAVAALEARASAPWDSAHLRHAM